MPQTHLELTIQKMPGIGNLVSWTCSKNMLLEIICHTLIIECLILIPAKMYRKVYGIDKKKAAARNITELASLDVRLAEHQEQRNDIFNFLYVQ
jgi:hypothetical protein